MKQLSTELQNELIEFLEKYIDGDSPEIVWAKGLLIQVKRKRKKRTKKEIDKTVEIV